MKFRRDKKDRELQDEYLRQKQDEPDAVFTVLFYLFKFIATILGVAIRSVPAIVSTLGILWLTNNSHIALAVLVTLIIVVLIVADVMNRLPKFVTHIVPFTSDSRRIVKFFKRLRARRRGKEILYDIGLLTDRTSYEFSNPAEFYIGKKESVFLVKPLRGIAPKKVVETVEANKSRWDAKRVRTEVLSRGRVKFTLFHVDPLDDVFLLEDPAELDLKTVSVECAINDVGEKVTMTFEGVAGLLVGGDVGSGKTAGMTTMLLPFALSPDVHMTVIDGKGSGDWITFEPAADKFHSGSLETKDLEQIRDLLEDEVKELSSRFEETKDAKREDLTLDSNFWNMTLEERRKENMKFHLIVIDEAQTVLDEKQHTKENREIVNRIVTLVATLVRMGRSAGFLTVIMTQKPTVDSVPSTIRGQLSLRIAFRVNDSDAERVTLGSIPEQEGAPRATEIPIKRKGGAVMKDVEKGGELTAIRFAYLSERRQGEIMNEFVKKHGRRNVEQTDKSQFSFSLDEYTKVEDSAVA